MSELRALLLTDVVDSTRLAEQLGDHAVAELWARHDRLARDLLRAHDGLEIDKADGFLMLFGEVDDAAAYALAYHRAIGPLGIQARAGVHFGPVILRDNPQRDVLRGAKPLEVESLAKSVAARVMGLARGGQTLLTPEARGRLGSSLKVVSHGSWLLRGVTEPVELFEVGTEDAGFEPPEDGLKAWRVVQREGLWVPARQIPHSLPRERDTFVGRAADLKDLAGSLDRGDVLVSVLGTGGCGKTRLVTRYSWSWLACWPGGVWFCDLCEARSLEGICHAVARALDVELVGGDPVALLGHAIAGRGRCLVVLDNFEQVTAHAADTLGRWLDRTTEARFLVTTREALGLPGETVLSLQPLPRAEAVDLFASRAERASRSFALTETTRSDIEKLVELLDRLPLAIVLAAARVRAMSPATLLERMDQRFRLLTTTGALQGRQSTLEAALDWSWDLLTPDEQRGLAQLSVFEGGFSLEAAEAVLVLEEAWPADVVLSLVDKSLVRQVDEERFDLLVSVQAYAARHLRNQEDTLGARIRHGAWFANLASDAALEGLELRGEHRAQFTAEVDNLVAATRRAIARDDGTLALRLTNAVSHVLAHVGPAAAMLDLCESLARLQLSPRGTVRMHILRARALGAIGRDADAIPILELAAELAWNLPDRRLVAAALSAQALHLGKVGDGARSLERYEEALALAREAGDPLVAARAQRSLPYIYAHMGRTDEALEHSERALDEARALGDRIGEAAVLGNLGILLSKLGRMDEARAAYEESIALFEEMGARRRAAIRTGNLANLFTDTGRPDEARAAYLRALEVHRQVGNRRLEGVELTNLASLMLEQGRYDEARRQLEQALVIHRELGNRRSEASTHGNLGTMHLDLGQPELARPHLETTLAIAREIGHKTWEGVTLGNLGLAALDSGEPEVARVRFEEALVVLSGMERRYLAEVLGHYGRLELLEGDLEEARQRLDEAESILRPLDASFELVSVLCHQGRLAHARQDADSARDRLAEAARRVDALQASPTSRIRRDVEALRDLLGA